MDYFKRCFAQLIQNSLNWENKFETDAFLASSHNKLQACKLFVFTFGLPSIEQAYADISQVFMFTFLLVLHL